MSLTTTRPVRRLGTRFLGVVPFLVSLTVVLVVLELVGRTGAFIAVPPVTDVAARFGELLTNGTLIEPLRTSLTTLGIGLAISIGAGTVIGLAMGLSPTVDALLDLYVKAGMSAPIIAFVPLLMLLFGIGPETRIATVVLFSIWVVIVNTSSGIRRADPARLEMARSFGTTRWGVLRQIRIVEATPYLLEGVRLGVARGVKGLINGEVLIAIVGLGGLVKTYGTAFSMDQLYAVILFIVLLALLAVGTASAIGPLILRHNREG
ncbi:ABC transporter permease [Jiangella endophytica]|uniref:ABC transporter permease n=1 Tax=Jiangella endophytica TaxID=1623398 RepID=UPI000E3527FC|nr:ABC transporter permease subunit [Jiangella endophytica]